MFTSIQHVNLCIGTLGTEKENLSAIEKAIYFYGNIIGLEVEQVPIGRANSLCWFKVGSNGQQIHCSFQKPGYIAGIVSEAHPCFTVPLDKLQELRIKLVDFSKSGHPATCGMPDSGDVRQNKGLTHVKRFFVRDFAGNRLEITAEL